MTESQISGQEGTQPPYMTKGRTRRTHKFDTVLAAKAFRSWLLEYASDGDYGVPMFHEMRESGNGSYCVEYSYLTDFARGVAAGIEWAHK